MKVEVRSQDSATKAALSVKVQSYEKALASVKGDLLRGKEKEDKEALLGGVGMRGVDRYLDCSFMKFTDFYPD